MIPVELLKKIRRIELTTSRIVNDILAGQYHSAFKGRGMEFEEVRLYQPGDDVRTIDWNVSARVGEPHVKVFREERELTVMLMVDLSASQQFGTHDQFKRELAAEISATLAFSAIGNNDKVGLICFTDRIEKFIPPRKGRRHVLQVIRELLALNPVGSGTDLSVPLEYLNKIQRRSCVAFLVSDFQADGYATPLQMASRRHDLILINVSDQREHTLPKAGLLTIKDSESGELVTIDTSSEPVRSWYAASMKSQMEARSQWRRRHRIDCLEIQTGDDIADALRDFFKVRQQRVGRTR
jgi:uncharacterized protein (DUF58 family)